MSLAPPTPSVRGSTRRLRRRPRLSVPLALALRLAMSGTVRADESPAERMFREARALMLQSRFAEACPLLEESQRLDPHVGTLLNLAACHERQGRVASAWVEYQKALIAARAEGQTERAALAESRIKVIEPRVPWLRVAVSSAGDDVIVALDGSTLAHAAWDKELPVDPGAHLVTATRRGTRLFEERVDLREGDHRTIVVEVHDAPPTPLPPAGNEPDKVVVESGPDEPAPALVPAKKNTNPWVLEPGLFVGAISARSRVFNAPQIPLRATTPTSATSEESCASVTCTLSDVSSTSATAGITLFGGYAFSDTVTLGARVLYAPAVSDRGTSSVAVGPTIHLKATETFTVGAWAFFGDGTIDGSTRATGAPPGYQFSGTQSGHVSVGLHGGAGLGVELALRLFTLPRGEVLATVTPFFVAAGSGNLFSLPLGLAYRFQ